MDSLIIRPIRESDKAQWLPLWQGYQAFYKANIADEVTECSWARIFDPNEPIHCLVAEENGELLGIVHVIFHRSMWTIGDYCYLQDLFIKPNTRGKGIGRKLIEAVYDFAREKKASRVIWLTQEDNYAGRMLYDRVADKSGFIQYRKML